MPPWLKRGHHSVDCETISLPLTYTHVSVGTYWQYKYIDKERIVLNSVLQYFYKSQYNPHSINILNDSVREL